jgi:hypothetical protein
MKISVPNKRDFFAGLLFIFFGLLAVLVARNYPMGSAVRMGPGYFPTLLGGALAFLGLMIAGRALWTSGDMVGALALRPLVFVLGATLAFALMVRSLGLVLATFALVVVSSLGGWEFRLREVTILAFVLTGVAVALFVYSLGLPLSVWPQ